VKAIIGAEQVFRSEEVFLLASEHFVAAQGSQANEFLQTVEQQDKNGNAAEHCAQESPVFICVVGHA